MKQNCFLKRIFFQEILVIKLIVKDVPMISCLQQTGATNFSYSVSYIKITSRKQENKKQRKRKLVIKNKFMRNIIIPKKGLQPTTNEQHLSSQISSSSMISLQSSQNFVAYSLNHPNKPFWFPNCQHDISC